jgi:hypothetical protein
MSNVFDIRDGSAYRAPMMKTGMRSVVSGINRFLDLLPEPLMLRAMQAPETSHRTRG